MAQRIKGQDVVVQILQNNEVVQQLADIRNFEMTPKFEKLEEQYLGQFSKKYDEIFHGLDFKLDLHLESSAIFTLVDAIKRRSTDRTGGDTRINITARLNFPSGGTRNITLVDCFFEDVPFTVGGRSEYVQSSFSGSCSQFTA